MSGWLVRLAWILACLGTVAPGGGRARARAGHDLSVITYNVWHGLRSSGSRWRLPGEDPARTERRFALQLEELRKLQPDVLLLQEVNPNQRRARRYARALGYDEIHKVTNCGIHLGPLEIPRNMNEGLAILARPELGLVRVGSKRLSGNAHCSATWGFQTRESRYLLMGQIAVGGRRLLLVTTHLSSPPSVVPELEERLEELVAAGTIDESQRGEIVQRLAADRARQLGEVRRLLDEIESTVTERHCDGVVLAGDFNARSGSVSLEPILRAGFLAAVSDGELATWDPLRNAENHAIGRPRRAPLPDFGSAELAELLERGRQVGRQIDHLFVEGGIRVASASLVMEGTAALRPSDHFGLLAELDLTPEIEGQALHPADAERRSTE